MYAENKLREYIRSLIEDELEEANSTASVGGSYNTPMAFSGKNNKGTKKGKSGFTGGHEDPDVSGYFVARDPKLKKAKLKKESKEFNFLTNTISEVIKEILSERLSSDAEELKLYIDNDSKLYKQRYIPILKNLSNKKKRNKFSKSLAVKAFMYLVDDGAKRYTKEYGGNPKDIFPKSKRTELAKEYVDEFESIFKNKEHDFME